MPRSTPRWSDTGGAEWSSVECEGGGGLLLQVQVLLLGHVDADAEQLATGEREPALVLVPAAHRIGAVEADAQPVAGQRELADLDPERLGVDGLGSDVERRGAE